MSDIVEAVLGLIFDESGWTVLNRLLESLLFPFIVWICFNLKHIIVDFKHQVLEFWDRNKLKCKFVTTESDEKSKGRFKSRLEIKSFEESEWVYGNTKEIAEKNLCDYFFKNIDLFEKKLSNHLFMDSA